MLEDELTVDPARECMEAVSMLHGVSISEGCGFESSDKSSGFFSSVVAQPSYRAVDRPVSATCHGRDADGPS